MLFILFSVGVITLCLWFTAVLDYRDLVYRCGDVYRRSAIKLLLRILWPIGLIYVIGIACHSIFSIFKTAITGKDE